jgi:hypothetical protein
MTNTLTKNSIFTIKYKNRNYLISENYSYKTEAYYTILTTELKGESIFPSSKSILDAYVVPICLEKSKLHDIPVCKWGISQGYIPTPAIVYGLNYFSKCSDFIIMHNQDKDAVNHLTNKGKYPVCYQPISLDSTIHSCISIFGITSDTLVKDLVHNIYKLFKLPLMTINYVKTGEEYLLSSISQVKYSKLSKTEKQLIKVYLMEGS